MKRINLGMVLAFALLSGCSKKSDAPAPAPAPAPAGEKAAETLASVEPAALATQLAAGECTAVDANGDGTREKMGVVPGAILLTDYETFSPTKELPSDKSKPLVFYCANEHCGASHQAAHRARVAGYEHVSVMPGGIAGWVSAGQKTDHPTKS